jgi:hypothetical protein
MRKSKLSLIVFGVSALIVVCSLFLPAFYLPQWQRYIIGFKTIFSGTYNGPYGQVRIGFSWGLFITFLLPVFSALLSYFFGTTQKSTYFFVLCLSIASIVLYFFETKFFGRLTAGYFSGSAAARLSFAPWTCFGLSCVNVILSLFGLFYKEDTRLSKKYH